MELLFLYNLYWYFEIFIYRILFIVLPQTHEILGRTPGFPSHNSIRVGVQNHVKPVKYDM